jgi:hypothetical protein
MDVSTVKFAASAASRKSLEFAINHVFLPPKTPREDDGSVPDEHTFISLLLESIKEFAKENPPAVSDRLGPTIRMIERLLKIKPGLDEKAKEAVLRGAVLELDEGGTCLSNYQCLPFLLLTTDTDTRTTLRTRFVSHASSECWTPVYGSSR